MAKTLNEIIRYCTDEYVSQIDVDDPPEPVTAESELVSMVSDMCRAENNAAFQIATAAAGGGKVSIDKLRAPSRLCASQIAALMLKIYNIVRIKCGGVNSDPSYDLLAIYQTDGDEEGIYTTDETVFKRLAKQYNYSISSKELADVMEMIELDAPRVSRTMDRDLIAVNNGIFKYDTKELLPFSPHYVFLAKSRVDYIATAVNVTIHNDDDGTDWDVESWMNDLSEDAEVVDVLWQILSAVIRPHVRWNKSAWFYSNTGNNGKGTLCELMRSLCGDGSYAAIPLSDFSKDFALEPLTRATAIIVDENDVGGFIDKAANLKAVITNDVIPINRKFKTPISYQFYGFMVQCLNEFPRIRDKSDSFYRRQLFIPFEKCFTGQERKYIKNDYLHRSDVLEYVMYKVLNMNFYTLSEPASCKTALEEYKEFNDPVRQFLDDMLPQVRWDLVPFSFLYDLYKAWFRKNSPNGSLQGKNTFIMDVTNLLPNYKDWYCIGRQTSIRPGHMMDMPEPLIAEYNLEDWKNPTYTGGDINRICMPQLKVTYNGIRRYSNTGTDAVSEE